jgi:uncharacterized protein (TIGR03083 family)
LYNFKVVEGEAMIREWIAAERRDLATLLDGLSAEQWDASSLCAGWTVRHVVAHLTMPFRYSTSRFLLELAKAGGRFERMSDGVASRDATMPTAELIAAVRDNAEHPWKPPGGGYAGALTHDVIHGLDIASPLRLERHVPADAMRTVLDVVTGDTSRRHFGVHIEGLEVRAIDLDWSSGSGAPVLGRAADLALLLTGRRVPPGALSGAGAGRAVRTATAGPAASEPTAGGPASSAPAARESARGPAVGGQAPSARESARGPAAGSQRR